MSAASQRWLTLFAAFQHLRTLARLLLVQPELRHILSDGGLLLAEVLDRTAGSTLNDARNTMGQIKSATGTFQNVAARALAAAKAAKANGPQDVEAVQGGKAALRQLGEGAAKGMPALDALRTQLKQTAKSGLPSKEVIDAELANKDAVPRLRDLQAQIQAASAEIATSPEQLERLKREALEGGIPDELRTALLGKPGEEGAIDPTDLVDAVQMLAVANPALHLTDKAKVKEVVGQAAKDAKKNAEDAWTAERRVKLIRRLRKVCLLLRPAPLCADCLTARRRLPKQRGIQGRAGMVHHSHRDACANGAAESGEAQHLAGRRARRSSCAAAAFAGECELHGCIAAGYC